MLINILLLLGGLALILLGANALTDGSSAIAKRFGISDLVIGLTVVAFGTSTPELVITVMSSIQDNGGLAIGNVVGSNIFNILVIIGVTSLIHPIRVERTVMSREIPMMVLSSLALLVVGNTPLLDGAAAAVLTRSTGLIFLIFFGLFMWYTFASASDGGADDPAASMTSGKAPMPLWRGIVWSLAGLAMLVYGGDLFVDSASGIASSLGVSDAIIGLTIAATGTSLPELATSVVAAVKGNTGLAIGNVIGSCIFNVFMILGIGASITPISFGDIGNLDLLTLMGASLLFLFFGWFGGKRVFTRVEGAIMTACYVAYITYLCLIYCPMDS